MHPRHDFQLGHQRRAGQGLPAALDALLLWLAEVRHITLPFVGTVLAEMTAGDSGIGYLMQTAAGQQGMSLAFAGLVTRVRPVRRAGNRRRVSGPSC
jgi:hypothetical protein